MFARRDGYSHPIEDLKQDPEFLLKTQKMALFPHAPLENERMLWP